MLALASTALLAVGLLPATSNAEITSTQPSFLAKIGPLSPDTGYPTYIEDSKGLRLAHCFDTSALCGGEASLPDPTKPVSFPDNFPDESFYFLAQTVINLPSGGRALFVGSVEAAFGSEVAPGQRAMINRLRLRIDTPNTGHYTVTTPYGVDEFDVTATGDRSINFTEDVGLAANNFQGILGGRVDPFLTWDTGLITAPDGKEYVGDPGTQHTVTGSPFGTNFFRIDGPDIGGIGVNTIQTNLFTLVGRVQTNTGIDPGHPFYSRTNTDGGMVDVLASTDPGKAVKARLAGGDTTTLRGGPEGRYVARLPFSGATPPASVTVSNITDVPPSVFSSPVTDLVTITNAFYDTDQKTLMVTAASSDQAVPPTLTAEGFGALAPGTQTLTTGIPDSATSTSTGGTSGLPTGGVTTVAAPDATAAAPSTLVGDVVVGTQTFTGVEAAPDTITVTSSAGGTSTVPVTVSGSPFPADPVTADAGPDQTVQQGQTVTLDGSNTINADSMAWVQTDGPAVTLAGSDTAVATFTAPATATTLTFQLIAQGPQGPSTDDIVITVAPITAPVANAGPDQTGVLVGNPVVLDATASTGAATFAWTQVSGPTVTLTNADTARPTFTMPATTSPLVFQVTVSGPGGSATDQVSVSASLDVLTITRAEYRPDKEEWRVEGTSSIPDNNKVSVFLGLSTSGPLIGIAQVNPIDGTWSVRVRNSDVAPIGSAVTVQSTRGGLLVGVPFVLH